MTWLLNIIGLVLCTGFVVLFSRIGEAAASQPVGEGWEEEAHESAADDDYYFRATADGVEVGALARED